MPDPARLLIIDDDEVLMAAVKLYLIKAGYEVISAMDGSDGLEKALACQPDVVVLDVMMPGLDGWQVCEQLKQVSDVPVIMLTARGQETDRAKGRQLGVDDYVIKPIPLKDLMTKIEVVLRLRLSQRLCPSRQDNQVP